ncbi:MAG: protein kinase [Candidatus Nanoarchaeia archaeon]
MDLQSILDLHPKEKRIGSGGLGDVYLMPNGNVVKVIKIAPLGGSRTLKRRVISEEGYQRIAKGMQGQNYFGEEAALRLQWATREGEVGRELQGEPNIIEVLGYQGVMAYNGLYAEVLMKKACGASLDSHLNGTFKGKDWASYPLEERAHVAREIIRAVKAGHNRGVIHGDIKPHNIFYDSSSKKVTVLDLGCARKVKNGWKNPPSREIEDFMNANLSSETRAYGTPAYIAPEQALGVVTMSGDIFSTGIVAYEVFTGDDAFVTKGKLGAEIVRERITYNYKDRKKLLDAAAPYYLPPAVISGLSHTLDPRVEARTFCLLEQACDKILDAKENKPALIYSISENSESYL